MDHFSETTRSLKTRNDACKARPRNWRLPPTAYLTLVDKLSARSQDSQPLEMSRGSYKNSNISVPELSKLLKKQKLPLDYTKESIALRDKLEFEKEVRKKK